jgi:hypothetical protein
MPIEDIDFLLENSQEESIIMLIDSRKRDRSIFPTPQEFEISFQEPFRFVIGFEVLHTSIPRTLFMIDTHNNAIQIRTCMVPYPTDNKRIHTLFHDSVPQLFEFVPQDYQTSLMFEQAINNQVDEQIIQVDNFDMVFVPDVLIHQRGNNEYPIIRFTARHTPFVLNVGPDTTMRRILGFATYGLEVDSHRYQRIEDAKRGSTPTAGKTCTNLLTYMQDTVLIEPLESQRTIDLRNSIRIDAQTYEMEWKPNDEVEDHYLVDINARYEGNPGMVTLDLFVQYEGDLKLCMFESVVLQGGEDGYRLSPIEYPFLCTMFRFRNRITYTFKLTSTRTAALEQLNVHLRTMLEIDPQMVKDPYNLVSIPIPNEDYVQQLKNLPPFTHTHHPEEIATLNRIGGVGFATQTGALSAPHPWPTEIIGKNQHIYELNVILSLIQFEITIPANTNLQIKSDQFFVDIYESDKLFIRVYLDAEPFVMKTESPSVLTLKYAIDATHLKGCVSGDMVHMNDFVIARQNGRDIQTSRPEFTYRLFHIGVEDLIFQNTKLTVEYVPIQCFAIQSPGVLNLTTENYLVMRCDEIENHVRGSYDVREYSPGIGLINIDVQGFAVDRTEFFSVKYKQFHPIGQLRKLKFRFERCSDGKLYDFKNVDLNFLLAIKFLRPGTRQKLQSSVLNPEYDPNYIKYMNRSLEGAEMSSEDDSEDEYLEEKFRRLESSSEDDDT